MGYEEWSIVQLRWLWMDRLITLNVSHFMMISSIATNRWTKKKPQLIPPCAMFNYVFCLICWNFTITKKKEAYYRFVSSIQWNNEPKKNKIHRDNICVNPRQIRNINEIGAKVHQRCIHLLIDLSSVQLFVTFLSAFQKKKKSSWMVWTPWLMTNH